MMSQRLTQPLRTLFLAALVLSAFGISAQELPAKFEKIIKAHGFAKEQLGLAVIDLSSKPQLVYGLNEEQDLIPASITKVATAYAVLQTLGASHKFQTGLYGNSIKDGVLKGDLYLKGGGDAGFVSETMWFLVNELVRTGIKKVEGGIVVDDSDFDSVRTDSSRDPERVDRAYDAPVGAMSFNWNSISIFVRPSKSGSPAQVFLDPIDLNFKVDSTARTGSGGASAISVTRSGSKISVRGTIGENAPEFVVYKNIDDPVEWAGKNLVFFLSQRGIEVKGKVKAGKKPSEAKLLAKADSKPVSQHVADMMKFSNNYVAEMLTKNLAVVGGVKPASLEEGMKVIRNTLKDGVGLEEKRFKLVNPSGLSRQNRMKAVDLAQILVKSYQHFPTFAESLSALPLAGMDGTLKNRMKGSSTQGWVRAKTGLLTGVVGLAGYAGRKDGSHKAFAFIFNGKGEQGEAARRMFDALATELVQ